MRELLWRTWVWSPVAVLLCSSAVNSLAGPREQHPVRRTEDCRTTPTVDLIAPMAGETPLWLVTAFGPWSSPDAPQNLYWVVQRDHSGDLVVTGHRIEGPGRARFKAGVEAPVSDQLVIPNAQSHAMIPGGATSEVLSRYSFRGGYAFFSVPGCWELAATLGEVERRFVVGLSQAED